MLLANAVSDIVTLACALMLLVESVIVVLLLLSIFNLGILLGFFMKVKIH